MDPRANIIARMYALLGMLTLFGGLVAVQLGRVHLVEGPALREQGQRQAESVKEIPAIRGTIYDQAGRALAYNTARYDLAVDPSVEGFRSEKERLLANLGRLTQTSAAKYRRRLDGSPSPKYALLARSLSETQKMEVDSWGIPGLILSPKFARHYTYGETASHVVGMVDADFTGIEGVEKRYHEFLDGTPGFRIVQRDMRGRIKSFIGGPTKQPEHGEHIVLTIDQVRQAIMEEELAKGIEAAGAKWGTAIAMDPHTGAILAMASVPTYDPNRPGATSKRGRFNSAVAARIEPGSTFKLVTAAAAVEEGAVEMDDEVDTSEQGYAVVSGRGMRDTHGHGTIPFREVISLSSNIGTARTALKLSKGTFYEYARAFGFGERTLIDLPGEVEGTLRKPETWSRISQAWMSHGYEIEATPLQLLSAYAALANGGTLMQPYVVAERRDAFGKTVWTQEPQTIRRVFSKQTAAELLPAFEEVVTDGTAKQAAIDSLRIAGKTGTAQKASGGSYDRRSYRASFAGFFPAERPEVAMIVVLDEPKTSGYGGVVAAPIFREVARRWIGTLPTIAERVAPALPFPEREEAAMPDVRFQPAAVARGRLVAARLPVRDLDEWTAPALQPVVAQRPGAGAAVEDMVSIETALDAKPTDEMPDLTGLSTRHAMLWLRGLGVDARVRGTGIITGQSPAAGTPLPKRAVLTGR